AWASVSVRLDRLSDASDLSTIASSRTANESAFTEPDTSDSPRPRTASMVVIRRFDVMGSAVNKTPAASEQTIVWITTAIRTDRWSMRLCSRYATARSVNSDAQHLTIDRKSTRLNSSH